MYKNVLASIPGIELYPIIALSLFFAFFIGLLVWFIRVDRARLNTLAEQALDDGRHNDTTFERTEQHTSRG